MCLKGYRQVGDGYLPASDFVVVLGEETSGPRSFLNEWSRVQLVGPLTIFGGGDDFANPEPLANKTETPAGSQIYVFEAAAIDPGTGMQVKTVLSRAGQSLDAGDNWLIQAGGAIDGLTFAGNNNANLNPYDFSAGATHTFKTDAVTGRVGVGSSAKNVADPDRSAEYFTSQTGNLDPTNVNDWLLF